jgi:hypothetical protein
VKGALMKRFVLFCLLVIWSLPLMAIDSASVNLPQTGDKALLFQLDAFFDISPHIGGNLTYLKFTAPHKAKRVGLTFKNLTMLMDRTSKNEKYNANNDTLTGWENDIDDDESSITMQLLIQWLRYYSLDDGLAFSFGWGPLVGINYLRRESVLADDISRQELLYRKESYYSGLSALAGVEWFFHPKFSLSAEYQNYFNIGWQIDYKQSDNLLNDGGFYKMSDNKDGLYFRSYAQTRLGISLFFNR